MNREDDHLVERQNPMIAMHTDSAMGIPVVLKNSVREAEYDGARGIIVPDLKGLEIAMAVARAVIDRKLNGEEIRFLRKALELKGTALAEHLDVTPETLSRWENGREVISTNAERLLRLRVVRALRASAPGVPGKLLDEVMDMKFSPVRAVSEPATMLFERLLVLDERDKGVKHVWCYRGLANSDQASTATKRTA